MPITLNGSTGLTAGGSVFTDASGNVGIGTDSPQASAKLHIYSTSTSKLLVQGTTAQTGLQTSNTSGDFHCAIDNSTGSIFGAGNYSRVLYANGAYPLVFFTNAAERMRIDSSGNVGIGTTSPGYKFDVRTTSDGAISNFRRISGTQNPALLITVSETNGTVGFDTNYSTSTPAITFSQGTNERLRIDSSGYVFINETATVGTASYLTITAAASSVYGATIKDSGTTYAASTRYMNFLNSSNAVAGSIQHTAATTTAFSTSSDARLKENIVDAPSATSILTNIPVRSYDWKEDGSHVEFGFVAQELEQIYAEPVGVGGDDVDANPWSIEYGRLTPLLVKALQEANAKIDALEARIAALEAK